jgi:hypothetical protein
MNDSYISISPSGTTYSGPDAVRLQQAITLRSAIKMYVVSSGQIIPTRGMGITKMLALATTITGKTYKRSQATQAQADLHIWIETMKSALPIFQQESA